MNASTRRALSLAAYGGVSLLFVALLWCASGSDLARNLHPIDLNAFYCGGKIFGAGPDPYRDGPLRSCEAAAYRDIGTTMQPYLVVPVPFPPYALWAFSVLRFVPFHIVTRLAFVVLLCALTLTVALGGRLAKLPLWVVTASLLLSDGIASIAIGQLVPLVVLALAASALALRARRYGAAAALAAATLMEPHVGIPVCAALAVAVPQSRRRLALVAVGLTALSLGPAPARALEYVTRVVPAQGRVEGELPRSIQRHRTPPRLGSPTRRLTCPRNADVRRHVGARNHRGPAPCARLQRSGLRRPRAAGFCVARRRVRPHSSDRGGRTVGAYLVLTRAYEGAARCSNCSARHPLADALRRLAARRSHPVSPRP